ncbi:Serine-type D-Ala-D-Ala carboxypeptidase [Modestobacter italicus]|uniref:Serine-type D-Ala-D-Ala carboxypeptidase n=1 Tax=Modestobacter italicus (strain DSM 44449 / CECT 9708 / BC 501) TaxID=2732864 RepID=I4F3I4_MODI5|nr:serine hydrolase [Modestobacter marinus]CCH90197.1 Serine-type D-Ala-D-Ala carboxypeptidase [Modestobacter marinus]
MRRPPPLRRLTAGVLVTATLLVGAAGPALAEGSRPTVDPSAPTPTAPFPGLPPQGSAPDGSTVGGPGLATRGIATVPGAPVLPAGTDARGWLVADAGTGEVLAASDPHGRYYPASTLKTLTLLTLAPVLDHGLVVEGTTDDEAVEGSRVGLVHGGQYPVDLLFRALVMQSGNDAANALARAAGGVGPTLAAMNTTAERLGAFDTVAGTPSGLDVAGQSSSPYDLALIMRQLVADPYTLDVLQTRTAQMPAVADLTPGYQIQSQDTLLDSYPGTLGGKTGFTDAARHTFVAAAERGGRRLVVSLMQAERRPVPELQQAVNLLDWGFSTAPDASGLGRLVEPGEVSAVSTPTVPTPTAAADGRLSGEEAASASAATAAPTPRPTAEQTGSGSPAVPLALAGGALLIVAATVLGVRRALRPVPRPGAPAAHPASRPGPAEGPPAAPGRPAG